MTTIPAARSEQRHAPVDGLRAHSTALRHHAERLRASAAALDWKGRKRTPSAAAWRTWPNAARRRRTA
ncbi:hypothetical protein WKI68_03850 [Streptomyces sp. MS1.HAVA.3]|uniref:Uncharacterized protein n=1 Tax=Streptomyces caledonius TaxID=3134107 RepID=A0ABU8TZ09_9ACTN